MRLREAAGAASGAGDVDFDAHDDEQGEALRVRETEAFVNVISGITW